MYIPKASHADYVLLEMGVSMIMVVWCCQVDSEPLKTLDGTASESH